ncbi:hypothetical protein PV325_000944 [Microctonus aethiopoides]|nr:hypothetical protein PV325_000944 [Microctonus aethiopoides]
MLSTDGGQKRKEKKKIKKQKETKAKNGERNKKKMERSEWRSSSLPQAHASTLNLAILDETEAPKQTFSYLLVHLGHPSLIELNSPTAQQQQQQLGADMSNANNHD